MTVLYIQGKNEKYLVKGVKDQHSETHVSGPPGNTDNLAEKDSRKMQGPENFGYLVGEV